MKDKLTIKGAFRSSGDTIYIDTWNPTDGWKTICLNDLMKDNISENRVVEIENYSGRVVA